MQYLTLFLLVGLGLASAYTSDFDDGFSVDRFENLDQLQAGGWISDQMKAALEKMVESFQKALEEGKTISEKAFRKAEEMYHKLLDWGIDVGEKVKEAIERIGRDFDNNRDEQADIPEHAGGWISDQMKEALEKMVESFQRALEEGKTISEKAFRKAEEMYHKLLDWGIDVGEKVKEAIERIGRDFDNNRSDTADMHAGGWIQDQMREALERMVEGFERALEEGKTISEKAFRKAEEMYHKLLDWGIDVGEKIKEALERIGQNFENNNSVQHGMIIDRLRETFERLVERIKERSDGGSGISGSLMKKAEALFEILRNFRVDFSEKIRGIFEELRSKMGRGSYQRGPMADRLKEAFEKVVNKMKEAFDSGSGIREDFMKRAEDIFEKLKNMKVEISEKIKSIFEDLRSKMGRNSAQRGPMVDRLKEAFEKVVNRMKEAFEGGSGVRGDLMKKAEDILEKLKNLKVEISEKIKSIFEDLRSKMGRNSEQGPMLNRLRESFEKIVNKIKSSHESGSGVKGDLWKKAQDIYDKLKNMRGFRIGDKIKSMFEELKNKMGRNGPVSQDASIDNVLDVFRRLKKLIKEKFDAEKLKGKVEELFGKGSEIAEQIIEMLRTKGEKAKQKILDWLDRIIPDKEERSISEVYDKLREYFKDLQLDLKERFTKFGEFIKEQYEKGLEKGKTRAENIKKIAKEFIEDTRVIGKDMAGEALGFFREYKEDLGKLYDNVVDKIGKILKS